MKTLRLVIVSTVITELVLLSISSYCYQCSIDNLLSSSKSWKYGPSFSKKDKVWLRLREMYAHWQQDTSTFIFHIILAGNISLPSTDIHNIDYYIGTVISPIHNMVAQSYDTQTYLHTIYDPFPLTMSPSDLHDTSSSTVNVFKRIINRFSLIEDKSKGSHQQHWTDILYITPSPLLFSNALGRTSSSAVNVHNRVAIHIMNHTTNSSSNQLATGGESMSINTHKIVRFLSKYHYDDDDDDDGFNKLCVQNIIPDQDYTSRMVKLRVESFKLKKTIALLNKTIDVIQENYVTHPLRNQITALMGDYFSYLSLIEKNLTIEPISYKAVDILYSKELKKAFKNNDPTAEPQYPRSHYFAVFGSFFTPLIFALSISFFKENKRYYFDAKI